MDAEIYNIRDHKTTVFVKKIQFSEYIKDYFSYAQIKRLLLICYVNEI
jgi:hypothetical protein